MAALRNDYVVLTATEKRSGKKMGRPAKRPTERLRHGVRAAMSDAELAAFEAFKKKNSVDTDHAALRKIFLDRMKADGFLKD